MFSISLLYGQPGSLDPGLDGDGKLTTSIGAGNDVARAVVVQPDGKIVVAGFAYNGTNNDFALARFNPDGTFDNSFSTDGKLTTPIGMGEDMAYTIALQTDGKIIAAGYSFNGSTNDFALVRYDPTGTLDNSFDGDGIVITQIDTSDDLIYGMVIQTDGKIVVAGSAVNGTDQDFALARYNVDGSLDSGFDTDGKLMTDFSAYDDKIFGITLQPDGKIVVAGYTDDGTTLNWGIARYHADGSLDNSFSADGKASISFGIDYNLAYALAVQQDGKIIIGGCTFNGVDDDFSLARFNADGSLDMSFDGDGKVVTPLGADDWIFSLLLQPDGKTVVAGYTGTGPASDFALVRYHTNGSLDNSFDTDGIVITDFSGYGDMAYGAAIQPDLKIILAGYSSNGIEQDMALARYISGLNIGVVDFSDDVHSVLIYPNPVLEEARLKYILTDPEEISIQLMDIEGKLVQTFVDHEWQSPGHHEQCLRLKEGFISGTYFVVLSSPHGMVIVKIQK